MQHHISQTLSTRDRLESKKTREGRDLGKVQFAYGATLLRPKENGKSTWK